MARYVRGDKKVVSTYISEFETERDHLDRAFAGLESEPQQFGTVPAGTGSTKVVFVADAPMLVKGFVLTNGAAIAFSAVDFSVYTLVNKGQAGVGVAVIATHTTAVAAGALAAFVPEAAPSVPAAGVAIAKGDVLVLTKTDFGAGKASTDLAVKLLMDPIF